VVDELSGQTDVVQYSVTFTLQQSSTSLAASQVEAVHTELRAGSLPLLPSSATHMLPHTSAPFMLYGRVLLAVIGPRDGAGHSLLQLNHHQRFSAVLFTAGAGHSVTASSHAGRRQRALGVWSAPVTLQALSGSHMTAVVSASQTRPAAAALLVDFNVSLGVFIDSAQVLTLPQVPGFKLQLSSVQSGEVVAFALDLNVKAATCGAGKTAHGMACICSAGFGAVGGQLVAETSDSLRCTPCAAGKANPRAGLAPVAVACSECGAGSFSLQGSARCYACPTGSVCTQGRLRVVGGYAQGLGGPSGTQADELQESDVQDSIHICPNVQACVFDSGSNNSALVADTRCAAGHLGHMCATCAPGFVHSSPAGGAVSACIPCQGSPVVAASGFAACGLVVFCLMVGLWAQQAHSSAASASHGQPSKNTLQSASSRPAWLCTMQVLQGGADLRWVSLLALMLHLLWSSQLQAFRTDGGASGGVFRFATMGSILPMYSTSLVCVLGEVAYARWSVLLASLAPLMACAAAAAVAACTRCWYIARTASETRSTSTFNFSIVVSGACCLALLISVPPSATLLAGQFGSLSAGPGDARRRNNFKLQANTPEHIQAQVVAGCMLLFWVATAALLFLLAPGSLLHAGGSACKGDGEYGQQRAASCSRLACSRSQCRACVCLFRVEVAWLVFGLALALPLGVVPLPVARAFLGVLIAVAAAGVFAKVSPLKYPGYTDAAIGADVAEAGAADTSGVDTDKRTHDLRSLRNFLFSVVHWAIALQSAVLYFEEASSAGDVFRDAIRSSPFWQAITVHMPSVTSVASACLHAAFVVPSMLILCVFFVPSAAGAVLRSAGVGQRKPCCIGCLAPRGGGWARGEAAGTLPSHPPATHTGKRPRMSLSPVAVHRESNPFPVPPAVEEDDERVVFQRSLSRHTPMGGGSRRSATPRDTASDETTALTRRLELRSAGALSILNARARARQRVQTQRTQRRQR